MGQQPKTNTDIDLALKRSNEDVQNSERWAMTMSDDKFQTISQWVDTNFDEVFWHFHTIFYQFLLYTSHKFNPNSSYLVRKRAGCGKEWWTMWKIPTQLKKRVEIRSEGAFINNIFSQKGSNLPSQILLYFHICK